jgi:hypothetical protein
MIDMLQDAHVGRAQPGVAGCAEGAMTVALDGLGRHAQQLADQPPVRR